MNDLDTELAVGLSSLVNSPAPPCAMDAGLAQQAGRAIKRRQRNTRAGYALAAVGLVGVLVAVGLPGLNHAANGPVTGPGASPRASTGPSVGASTGATAPASPGPQPTTSTSDPVLATLDFGWLPSWVTVDMYQWSTGGPLGDGTTLEAQGGGAQITADVEPPGKAEPPMLDGNGNPVAPTPAPDVNGSPALWADGAPGHPSSGTGQMAFLEWKNAADSWVMLSVSLAGGLPGDATTTIYRVAESMRFNLDTAVAVPFRLAQAPPGLPLSGSGWGAHGPETPSGLGASVTYGDGSIDRSGANQLPQILTISVHKDMGTKPYNGQHITVDGATAWIASSAYSAQLVIYNLHGLDVSINVSGTAPMAYIAAAGGIVAYFEHTITLLGPDKATWTTTVVN